MFKFPSNRKTIALAVTAATVMLQSEMLLAQQSPSAHTLEEVVVTARKRSENLQDVPMAVSAFTTETLRTFQVDELVDVARMSPNVQMNETSGLVGGAISVFMRGIGNDPGLDQGVGIYVDDVYLNRTSGAMMEVFDVDRIELLKGPQGNLYGRNTIGGAVKYITQAPGDEFAASLELKGGSDGYMRTKGAVSGALLDSLNGGVAFVYKERDGYQDNDFDNSEPWDAKAWAVRGQLLWKATEDLNVRLVTEYSKDDSKPPIPNRVALDTATISGIDFVTSGASLFFGPGTGVLDTPNDVSMPKNEDDVSSEFTSGYARFQIEQTNVAVTADWAINDIWSLKSVTALRTVEYVQPFDFDGSDQLWISTIRDGVESDDFSQEFQLNYSSGNINGVLGAYYLDGKQTQDTNTTNQTIRLRAVQYHNKDTYKDDRDVESYSIYSNVDWDFAEDWQLSIGGRYTEDKKKETQKATVDQGFYALARLQSFVGLPPAVILAIKPGMEAQVESSPLFAGWAGNSRFLEFSVPEDTNADDSWNEFTPSAKLSWHMDDNTMFYGGVATGFKSGGFNRNGGNATAYDPETVTTYSLGLKTTLLDETLRINTEAFYNDYSDKQLSGIQLLPSGDLQEVTSNVGEVTSSGVEFEVSWLAPIDGLMFNFNVGYLDTEVDKFDALDKAGNKIDLSDTTELGYAPKWTGQARASYEMALGSNGYLTLASDLSYTDEMYTSSPIDTLDPLQTAQQADDIWIWNAMAAYQTNDGRWRVAVEGKNLNDERALVNTFDIGIVATGGYNPPRTWALSLGYNF